MTGDAGPPSQPVTCRCETSLWRRRTRGSSPGFAPKGPRGVPGRRAGLRRAVPPRRATVPRSAVPGFAGQSRRVSRGASGVPEAAGAAHRLRRRGSGPRRTGRDGGRSARSPARRRFARPRARRSRPARGRRPRAGRDRRARGRANRLRAGDRADRPPSRPVRRGPEPRRRRRCAAPAASGTPLAPRLTRRDCPAKPGTAERGTVARRGGTARRSPARRPGTPRGPFGANPGLDPRVRRRHNDVSHRHVTGWLGGPASPVMGMGPRSERRPPATGHTSGAVVPAKVRAPRVRWLPRERLDKLLPQLWTHRLALVVAPAGSGKTTLLAGWAAMADHPVAWYRAESTDGSEAGLVACLEAAFASAVAAQPARSV